LVAQHGRTEPQVEPNWSESAGLAPPESVAETLRRVRQERDENLRDVAEILRVRLAYLQALEDGDHERLPGTAYALGFLRSYAEHLGLDSFEMVERYKAERQGSKTHADLVFPEPVADGRIPGGAIILISALLLALVYGGWTYFSSQETTVGELVPELPSRLQELIPSESPPEPAAAPAMGSPGLPQDEALTYTPPAAMAEPAPESTLPSDSPPVAPPATSSATPADTQASAPSEPATPGADTGAAATGSTAESALEKSALPEPTAVSEIPQDSPAPAAPEPATESAAQPGTAQATEVQAVTAAASAAPEAPGAEDTTIPAPPTSAPELAALPGETAPRTYGDTAAPSRIVLRATQDSWVQVRDAEDSLLLTRVLRAGDRYNVPDRPGLTLLTGNAGGIAIEVDGVTLPALGPVGAVRRQVALDPDQLVETLSQPE
jgi:cytoskeletal protein RodZ